MSLSKLLVPLNVVLQNSRRNLFKLQNCLASTKCSAAESGKLCPKPRQSRSERYREALQRCPKTQSSEGCADKRPEDPRAQRNAAELYRQAFAEVAESAVRLQLLARNSVDAILASMRAAYDEKATAEKRRVDARLGEIATRIGEIERMSLVCAERKRNQGYVIGERIRASFRTWQCENQPGARCVKCRLTDLECKVKERTETAVGIVTACKGCPAPANLIRCVDTSAAEAESILRMTDEYARKEIESVERLKAEVLQENGRIVGELMAKFEKEVEQFVRQLDLCIEELKKMQS